MFVKSVISLCDDAITITVRKGCTLFEGFDIIHQRIKLRKETLPVF